MVKGNKNTTKVIYKPDSQSTDEYIIIVNPVEYKKWKEGDKTIALAEVVDSFDVFHSGQGSQGLLGKVSNQTLDTVFNTHKDTEVVEIILEKGVEKASDGIAGGGGIANLSRGAGSVDSRGA